MIASGSPRHRPLRSASTMKSADELELFAACLPGLEPLVARECAALGLTVEDDGAAGGVSCRGGDFADAMRLNLHLGCASHVLLRIARFRARHFAELQKRADAVPWRRWLRAGVPFRVRATSRQSKLRHTGGIAERVEGAIERALGSAASADAEAVPVQVRFLDDHCTVSIDTSGRPLHERGWRLETAKAPLREDLAHALVLASGWHPASPLVDPFCGSGTVPICAAVIARRLPPGGARSFAFERLAAFDASAWERLLVAAREQALERAPAPIVASDRDAGAVASAGRNAARAGVAEDLELHEAPLSTCPGFELATEQGAVVTNPPFGRRVGDATRLGPLFQSLGGRVRSLPAGWRVAVLAADRRLALRTGLPLRTALLTNHGGLRVRALVA